jgi:hypothetical protein
LNRCENSIYEQIADIQGISNALRDLGLRCEKIGLFLDARTAYKKIIGICFNNVRKSSVE